MDVLAREPDLQEPATERRRAVVVGAIAVVGALVAAVLIATQWPYVSPGKNLPVSQDADLVNGTPGHWVNEPNAPGLTGAYIAWTGSQILAGPSGVNGALNPWKVFSYDVKSSQWRTAVGPAALKPRTPYATVWDGTELLFIGGWVTAPPTRNTPTKGVPLSEAYNPTTNTWRALPDLPGNPERTVNAVWTGSQVIVFSGQTNTYIYDPKTNKWTLRVTKPTGLGTGAVVTWTGEEVLAWGGTVGNASVATGWRYNPDVGLWKPMAAAPVGASNAASAWTGNRLLVWGGVGTKGLESFLLTGGYSYDPTLDSWTPLPAAPYAGLVGPTATWTGDAFLIWGRDPGTGAAAGAAYDPVSGAWRPLSNSADVAGQGSQAFWTGTSMLVIGGWGDKEVVNGSSPHLAIWTPDK